MDRLGRMRHRLAIQSATETPNAYGEPVKAWSTVATRWGRVEPMLGNERYTAQQVVGELSHKITMRYYSGLTPKHRLVFGSRVFHIESIITEDEIENYIEVQAREQVT